MKSFVLFCLEIYTILSYSKVLATKCGCRSLSPCYANMFDHLHDVNEAYCVEDAAMGSSSITVFMKALNKYCSDIVNVTRSDLLTHNGKHLYQVVISTPDTETRDKTRPIIIIDAGQDAGYNSVSFALYLIEQLVACEENLDMIRKVRWVVLPSTNPDGMEFARHKHKTWQKNLNIAKDLLSFGVDITLNFNKYFKECPEIDSPFARQYHGPAPASENETTFIKSVLDNFHEQAKIYISLRKDGHHIAYPFAYSAKAPKNVHKLKKVAAEVTAKVNMRSHRIKVFANGSIFDVNGKGHCGHSVDYAHELGIPLCYEMGVFLEAGTRLVAKFLTPPRGTRNMYRNGYFIGIKELYNVLTNEKKYGKIFE